MNRAAVIYVYDGRWALGIADGLVLFVCHLVCTVMDFSAAEKEGRKILHECWPTIRTGLLPFR